MAPFRKLGFLLDLASPTFGKLGNVDISGVIVVVASSEGFVRF